ncbi:MAG: hypothetical protein ACD_79C00422G0012 [uncultured bacterium]|nr:MAG: hypothetical protein ACD_79C00422G0012 [uncultured bacterium]
MNKIYLIHILFLFSASLLHAQVNETDSNYFNLSPASQLDKTLKRSELALFSIQSSYENYIRNMTPSKDADIGDFGEKPISFHIYKSSAISLEKPYVKDNVIVVAENHCVISQDLENFHKNKHILATQHIATCSCTVGKLLTPDNKTLMLMAHMHQSAYGTLARILEFLFETRKIVHAEILFTASPKQDVARVKNRFNKIKELYPSFIFTIKISPVFEKAFTFLSVSENGNISLKAHSWEPENFVNESIEIMHYTRNPYLAVVIDSFNSTLIAA